jgi:hypothetical protein
MVTPIIRLVVAFLAIVILTPGVAFAAVPTTEDFTHCNEKAKKDMETAAASPQTDDTKAKVTAAAANVPKEPPANTGKAVTKTEADPQLQGIDPEGEKDPAYIAAYKSCMRQSGF